MASIDTYPGYDTLEEAAEAVGVNAQALVASVARWNELVEAGVDEDFGADMTDALPILTAPYHVAEGIGCLPCVMGGPVVDKNLQVLDSQRRPIAGLYGGGNCITGFHGPIYEDFYQFGPARAFSCTSGYLTAKNALAAE